jgi:mRNA interferase MazF
LKKGEIWLADLEPVKGSEQGKIRPIVIISGNTMNEHFSVIITCPLSSIVKNYAGCVVVPKSKTNGLSCDSEIITFQVRSISKDRLFKKIGTISALQMQDVLTGLNDVLNF